MPNNPDPKKEPAEQARENQRAANRQANQAAAGAPEPDICARIGHLTAEAIAAAGRRSTWGRPAEPEHVPFIAEFLAAMPAPETTFH